MKGLFSILSILPVLAAPEKCPPCPCMGRSAQSFGTSKPSVLKDLFITVHPSKIQRFQKYFANDDLLHGIDSDHDDQSLIHNQQNRTFDKFINNCAGSINYEGKYLVSSLGLPSCPRMEFDDAVQFCWKRNMKPVSVSSELSQSDKESLYDLVHKIGPFWTDGFIRDPRENTIYWNDFGEPIEPSMWGLGQPDGPMNGLQPNIQFCVAIKISGKNGKLHDELCRQKFSVVCEKNQMIPNLNFMN